MKKPVLASWISICVLVWPFSGFSATPAVVQRHTFEAGAEFYYMGYEEPGIMENTGFMSGLAGSYTYYRDYFVAKFDGRIASGKVDYKSTSTGSQKDIWDSAFEIRGVVGYDFLNPAFYFKEADFSCIPYVGFGYRYLNDDSSGRITTTGYLGYERESMYLYVPVGVTGTKYFLSEQTQEELWSLGGTLEWDFFCWGTQTSRLGDVNPAYSDIRNKQSEGFGVRGSLAFRNKTRQIDILFEPFFRYWHISQSDQKTVSYAGTIWGQGYEPKNSTKEIGCKLAFIF